MDKLVWINFIISAVFIFCYSYQFFYLFVSLIRRPKKYTGGKNHKYAVIISARNEESVIGNLIDSINRQNYPSELIDVFVAADNCTDLTAEIAEKYGAHVYVRNNKTKVGKGFALEYLFEKIDADYGLDAFEGYFIFDADNLLDENYIAEMNKAFDDGNRIITSRRNSKNYSTNWISAGYALWFLREARQLNNPRMLLNTSCAVSGTGFMFHRDIIKRSGGWKYFLLTEDIEFTVDNVLHGEKIAYCHDAMFYDEQPETFGESWRQRMRWAKGYYQVYRYYGLRLLKGTFRGRGGFSCFDMNMTIMPAIVLTILSFLINSAFLIPALIIHNGSLLMLFQSVFETLKNSYLMLFVLGIFTGITEWKSINCPIVKKILFFFTFPVFMLTYIPISIAALFKKVKWTPVRHKVSLSIDKMKTTAK